MRVFSFYKPVYGRFCVIQVGWRSVLSEFFFLNRFATGSIIYIFLSVRDWFCQISFFLSVRDWFYQFFFLSVRHWFCQILPRHVKRLDRATNQRGRTKDVLTKAHKYRAFVQVYLLKCSFFDVQQDAAFGYLLEEATSRVTPPPNYLKI